MTDWYEIKAQSAGRPAEIFLYEPIGTPAGEGSVTAKAFIEDLRALGGADVDLHINSPGGSVFDGQAIYTALQRYAGRVTTHVDGVAASIASLVAMAGERRVMADNAVLMIHEPYGEASGWADDMRRLADTLDMLGASMARVYARRSGMAVEAVREAMAAETWYTAEEALAAGFADELAGPQELAAHDLSQYRHPPGAAPGHKPARRRELHLPGVGVIHFPPS